MDKTHLEARCREEGFEGFGVCAPKAMQPAGQRLEGLDIARYIALIGMVVVNFDMVMVGGSATTHQSSALAEIFQGRAAATFIILAGIGFGLGAARNKWGRTVSVTLKRALFLLVLGLLNSLIFDADIIHYYAIYFLFGVLFVRAPSAVLWLAIVGLAVGFVGLTSVLNYETGWNWDTFAYRDFWEPRGFVRNLFFNGWHPVVPWLAFLLFGIWLSRLDLWSKDVQIRLAVIGGAVLAVTFGVSRWLIAVLAADDPEAAHLFGTAPIPPMPLYLIAGSAAACLTIGLCLLLASTVRSAGILAIAAPAGRQTLTLYIAHIVIGMGTLEALQMIGGQTGQDALIASLLFCILATIYSVVWTKFFKHGPLETLMRRLAG